MTTEKQAAVEKMIFRKTNAHAGRHVSITPSNSRMRHLAYGRIRLDSSKSKESFSTGNRETGLICLSGQAVVAVEEKDIEIGPYDAIYIPRDSSVADQSYRSREVSA